MWVILSVREDWLCFCLSLFSCYLTMTSTGQKLQNLEKDSWKPLNIRKGTLVKGGTEMPEWTEFAFEKVMDDIIGKQLSTCYPKVFLLIENGLLRNVKQLWVMVLSMIQLRSVFL